MTTQPPDAGVWAGALTVLSELDDKAHSATLEYALAAILDCHTRIVAKHVPTRRVRRVRAGYRDRSIRAALAHRTERR